MPIFMFKSDNMTVPRLKFELEQPGLIFIINLISFTKLIQWDRAWQGNLDWWGWNGSRVIMVCSWCLRTRSMWVSCMEIIDRSLSRWLVLHEMAESVRMSIVQWIGRVAMERCRWNGSKTISGSHNSPIWCHRCSNPLQFRKMNACQQLTQGSRVLCLTMATKQLVP